jgi:hypothetical protein
MPSIFALVKHTTPPRFKGRQLIIRLNEILELLTLQRTDFEKQKIKIKINIYLK